MVVSLKPIAASETIVTGDNVYQAQQGIEELIAKNNGEGHPASMPELIAQFPVDNPIYSGTEEWTGLNSEGKPVVATFHPGEDVKWGALVPYIVQEAVKMGVLTPETINMRNGFDQFGGVLLRDIYDKPNIFSDLLEGSIPWSDKTVPVYSYHQFLRGFADVSSAYIVVRTMGTAIKGPKSFVLLKDVYAGLETEEGKEVYSQLIISSGGIPQAKTLLDKVNAEGSEGFGIYVVSGEKYFRFGTQHNPDDKGYRDKTGDIYRPAARFLRLGADAFEGLEGYVLAHEYSKPANFLYIPPK